MGTSKRQDKTKHAKFRTCMYVVDGIEDTIAGHCRRLGVSRNTVSWRMSKRCGMTLEQALKAPCKTCHGRKYTYRGVTGTLPELCAIHGKDYNAVYRRVKSGWSISDAMDCGRYAVRHGRPYNEKKYVVRGREYTVKELAEKHGVQVATMRYRLKHGVSLTASPEDLKSRRHRSSEACRLADKLGLSANTVRSRIKSRRVPKRHAVRLMTAEKRKPLTVVKYFGHVIRLDDALEIAGVSSCAYRMWRFAKMPKRYKGKRTGDLTRCRALTQFLQTYTPKAKTGHARASRRLGGCDMLVDRRLHYGWTLDEALTTPRMENGEHMCREAVRVRRVQLAEMGIIV